MCIYLVCLFLFDIVLEVCLCAVVCSYLLYSSKWKPFCWFDSFWFWGAMNHGSNSLSCFVLLVLGTHLALADLELAMELRMTLSSWSSWPHLPSVCITVVYHPSIPIFLSFFPPSLSFFQDKIFYIAQSGLEFVVILLPQPLWDFVYSYVTNPPGIFLNILFDVIG